MTTVLESLKQALAMHRAGRLDEAVEVCRAILQADPGNAHALHLQGAIHLQRGQVEDALALLTRAVELESNQVAFHATLASARLTAGRVDDAIRSMRQVLRLRPDHAQTHNDLGVLLARQGVVDEAETCFRKALELKPNYGPAHNNLGNILNQLGRTDEAIECFRHARRVSPKLVQAYNNLANALAVQGKSDEAIAEYQEAVRISPDYAEGYYNLGLALHAAGRSDEARMHLTRAMGLRPTDALFQLALATVLIDLDRLNEAHALCDAVLRTAADDATARYLRGTIRLAQGNFAEGWDDYEARTRTSGVDVARLAEPLWNGEPLAGRTLLVHCEQGLGDTLQFIRYVKTLANAGGPVVIAAHRKLIPLLEQSGYGPLVAREDPLDKCDVQIPLLSLPRLAGTRLESIPREVPYLKAEPARIERWQRELAPYQGLKVGLVWQGRPGVRNDRQRSIPLECFAPLALGGVRLFSLQKGPGSDQLEKLAGRFEVIDLARQLDHEGGAFLDTAAVMKELDLVIACDTSAAHLAGGLAVPVWVALSAAPEWRWLRDRDDCPWYPTMRLFRQRELGQWNEVFERIAAALAERLQRRG